MRGLPVYFKRSSGVAVWAGLTQLRGVTSASESEREYCLLGYAARWKDSIWVRGYRVGCWILLRLEIDSSLFGNGNSGD